MRATRHVVRRMLTTEACAPVCCPWRSVPGSHHHHHSHHHRHTPRCLPPPRAPGSSFRRHFFGAGAAGPKANPWTRTADLDPGLDTMLDLSTRARAHDRPPAAAQLADAFRSFFRAKRRTRTPLLATQVDHAARTLQHLLDTNQAQPGAGLTRDDLELARDALVDNMRETNSASHARLARLLHAEISARNQETTAEAAGSMAMPCWAKDLVALVAVLCQTGDAREARALVLEQWRARPHLIGRKTWSYVLLGLAREDRHDELERTLAMMEACGTPFDAKLHQDLTTHYAQRDDVPATQKWYARPIARGQQASYHTRAQILRFCIRTGQMAWGEPVFRAVVAARPRKKMCDLILLWAAASGRGVDEIERMMRVMVQRQQQQQAAQAAAEAEAEAEADDDDGGGGGGGGSGGGGHGDDPQAPDIETINGLVEWAHGRRDPYTAERYVALGQKWGMEANARTWVLQMRYRLDVGDLDGVRAAYGRLQREQAVAGTSSPGSGDDLAVVNQYIRALVAGRASERSAIEGVVADVEGRGARLEPTTVLALCMWHLVQHDDLGAVLHVLQDHTGHYSPDQRATIATGFVAFICDDAGSSTAQAWDAYTLLTHALHELAVDTRLALMAAFFRRQRSDMAAHVFGQLVRRQRQQQQRQRRGGGAHEHSHEHSHEHAHERPLADAYVACFEGIGRAADVQALEMVHNLLKLDAGLEPDTRLLNSLMLAYLGCDMPDRALDFWAQIARSRPGPSRNSIAIALRACECSRAPHAEHDARRIWARLHAFRVPLTTALYAAYVAALAAHGRLRECCGLVDAAPACLAGGAAAAGSVPDLLLLGTLYNACPSGEDKAKIERWIRYKYPPQWDRLRGEEVGLVRAEDGGRVFRIDRELRP
ncbi:MAG: hypothetical protein M1826_006726 [Phylliscum demangeonii]|nr:MAG: hypothetical protein M1826_006726 [Phylliscum demangeonii]